MVHQDFTKSYFLTDLLPYDLSVKTGKRLVDGLRELLLLIKATDQAMVSLKKGKYKDFDPLVGENACQIRAVKLALFLSSYPLNCTLLFERVSVVQQRIEVLLSDPSSLIKRHISLKELIHSENLDVIISGHEIFFIKSYLLSKVKTLNPLRPGSSLVKNEVTDTKKIKQISTVGSMFADHLVKALREKLSESSVAFVQTIAEELSQNDLKKSFSKGMSKHSEVKEGLGESTSHFPNCLSLAHLDSNLKMVSDEFIVRHRGLYCLPYYWATRVVMLQALRCRIPIFLIAEQKAKDREGQIMHQITLYFEPTEQGYQLMAHPDLSSGAPALFLVGVSYRNFEECLKRDAWILELVETGPIDLVLAYAAAHRQYPDLSKEAILLPIKDPNYEYHQLKAFEWGCSLENPSRFFLAHAFCDQVSNLPIYAQSNFKGVT
jgi:hypothetical protein